MLAWTSSKAASALRTSLRRSSTTATPTAAAAASSTPAQTPTRISEAEYAATVVHGRSVRPPYRHPKTHGVPAATLHLRSYHARQLDLFAHFAGHAAAALAVPLSAAARLPTARRLWTVLRGPFAHKKSQENFERRTHKRAMTAWDAHPDAVDVLVRYLETHAMPGVGMRVVRWRRAPVGVGERLVQEARAGLRIEGEGSREKVKALGDAIVQREMATAGAAAKEKGVAVGKA